MGEALVGNEAVDQLVKFNQAMADNSSAVNPHLIDGIVLTKFDTIDDKVCIHSCCTTFILLYFSEFLNYVILFTNSRLVQLFL